LIAAGLNARRIHREIPVFSRIGKGRDAFKERAGINTSMLGARRMHLGKSHWQVVADPDVESVADERPSDKLH
jgi:hypothetical protein